MRDISSHILDIAENSVVAEASLVRIYLDIDEARDLMTLFIGDNGKGMDEELVARVVDPFVTSRTTRKVGLGLPLLKAGTERAGGDFYLKSALGVGTEVTATYQLSNIDRPPLGELGPTIHSLIQMNPAIDFHFKCVFNGQTLEVDTRKLREALGEVPLDNIDVSMFILDDLKENFQELLGGKEI